MYCTITLNFYYHENFTLIPILKYNELQEE